MSGKLYGKNIDLPPLDNLFSSESDRQDAKLEKVQNLRLDELFPFREHPFHVRDDEEMDKMVESIREYGILTPAIVRPRPEGGYELVSGHRRHHGCARAGLETMPCIVREMDDDTAVILMVDSNCSSLYAKSNRVITGIAAAAGKTVAERSGGTAKTLCSRTGTCRQEQTSGGTECPSEYERKGKRN